MGREMMQAFFDVCRSQTAIYGVTNWSHNYGGLASEDAYVPRSFRLDHPAMHDPTFPTFHAGFHVAGDDAIEVRSSIVLGTSSTADPFQHLVPEIRDMIAELLSTASVVNLRLASRCFASMTLAPSFWRSRFSPSHEFECLLPLAQTHPQHRRWRQAYMEATSISRTPSFVNRQRIWSLVSEISDMMDASIDVRPGRMQESHLVGKGMARINPNVEEEWAPLSEPQWLGTSPILPYNNLPTRIAEANYALRSRVMSISVCFVQQDDNKTYVSGLILGFATGDLVHLGYTKSQKHGELPHETACWDHGGIMTYGIPGDLVGFHVASDRRGFVGLSVLSHPGGASS